MSRDGLTLLDPWFLALAPAVLLLLALRLRRPRAALPTASLAPLCALPRTLRQRLVHLPLLLHSLGLLALVGALARPAHRELLPLRGEGVDILLVLDTSSSMLARDMDRSQKVTRMMAARERALAFAAARVHDRVGLLTFALFADLRCPLTLDQAALAEFLRQVDTVRRGSQEDQTAIGTALAAAVKVLKTSPAKSRVVVLLSDGENNAGVPHDDAARLAKEDGVRVHTIGIGQGTRDPFSFGEPLRFTALREIAATTGGTFFLAETAETLAQVYAEIDRMEKVELEDPRYRTTDLFVLPVAAGAALLLLGVLLRGLWIKEAP